MTMNRAISSAALVSLVGALAAAPAQVMTAVAATYLLASIVLGALAFRRPPSRSEQIASHLLDIGAVSVLVALTEGLASPFFVLFVFALLTSTLRWTWRGTIATAVLLLVGYSALAFLVHADEEPDSSNLARTVNRAAFLLVGGTLLAYMGAYRDRSRQRLAQLVAWPGPDRSSGAAPANAAVNRAGVDGPELLAPPAEPAQLGLL